MKPQQNKVNKTWNGSSSTEELFILNKESNMVDSLCKQNDKIVYPLRSYKIPIVSIVVRIVHRILRVIYVIQTLQESFILQVLRSAG
jgi:hypothetical protein